MDRGPWRAGRKEWSACALVEDEASEESVRETCATLQFLYLHLGETDCALQLDEWAGGRNRRAIPESPIPGHTSCNARTVGDRVAETQEKASHFSRLAEEEGLAGIGRWAAPKKERPKKLLRCVDDVLV